MISTRIKDLTIRDLDELKTIYIFIGDKCYSIINYNNRNDLTIDMEKDEVILKYKNKNIIKYNKVTNKFKIYTNK